MPAMGWKLVDTDNPGCFVLYHPVMNEIYSTWNHPAYIFYTSTPEAADRWIEHNILTQEAEEDDNSSQSTTRGDNDAQQNHSDHSMDEGSQNIEEEVDEELIQRNIGKRIIGFDTESKVIRKKGDTTFVCLIQLCVTHKENGKDVPHVLLFHCKDSKILPKSLIYILESPYYLKCGVGMGGLSGDCAIMQRDFGVNTRGWIEMYNFTRTGLKKSVSQCFRGVTVPLYKHITCSNWLSDRLNRKQIMYSTLDAVYGHALGKFFVDAGRTLENEEDTLQLIERCLKEKKERARLRNRKNRQKQQARSVKKREDAARRQRQKEKEQRRMSPTERDSTNVHTQRNMTEPSQSSPHVKAVPAGKKKDFTFHEEQASVPQMTTTLQDVSCLSPPTLDHNMPTAESGPVVKPILTTDSLITSECRLEKTQAIKLSVHNGVTHNDDTPEILQTE